MIKGIYWLASKLSALGEGLIFIKSQLQCGWNSLMIKLTFNVKDCPNKLCKCK